MLVAMNRFLAPLTLLASAWLLAPVALAQEMAPPPAAPTSASSPALPALPKIDYVVRGKDFHVLAKPQRATPGRTEMLVFFWYGSPWAAKIDPYLRAFHQQRNLMELLETVSRFTRPEDEVAVHVVTVEDEFNGERQTENFQKIEAACTGIGIQFSWAFDTTGTKHDRDITTDHGWKIVLSRGLDVFQRCELNDAFSFANRMQQHRQCKEFNVTFVKLK